MKAFKYLSIFILTFFVLNSCQDFNPELEVDYTTNPTLEATANEETALGAFQYWYNNVNAYYGPGLALTTMADMNTCSWGNGGMRDMSSEPRVAWDNDPGYGNAQHLEDFYNSMYQLFANQSNIVKAMEDGLLEPSDPAKIECLARFGQAAGLGSIALVIDRVWAKDETGTLFNGEAATPAEAMQVALEKLDKAISLAENNSFDVNEINGMSLSSAQFAEFLNSYGARLLANLPRNSSQRDALNWNRVLNYANKGLTFDLNVLSDGWTTWYTEWVFYSIYPGWGRVDMRVINLMDPNTPDYFTETSGFLPPSTSDDARLLSDFQYLDSQDFIPSRGIYHYSSYRHSRYDDQAHGSNWTGATPEMLKAENDLYKAEAIYRSGGSLADAVAVINSSTRVTRGGLDPIGVDAEEFEAALHYERSVELLSTGMGLGFFEMRKNDLLQEGTPLHLPVPGSVLLSGQFDIYTLGGTSGVPGEDYSTGGWR